MDRGGGATTEIDYNTPEIAGYLAQNPELLDCFQGLLHSHHTMSAFFSGTDQNTLLQEGKDMNNFVSLIVNNAGNYVAGITRRVTQLGVRKVTTKQVERYPFFNFGEVTLPESERSWETPFTDTVVEWYPLTVEREYADIDDAVYRFGIVQRSTEVSSTSYKSSYPKLNEDTTPKYPRFDEGWDIDDEYPSLWPKPEEPVVSKTQEIKKDPVYDFEKDDTEPFLDILWDEEEANYLLKQLLFGTPFVDKKRLSIASAKSIEQAYASRFHPQSVSDMEAFTDFINGWVDWILLHGDITKTLRKNGPISVKDYPAIIATKLYELLGDWPADSDYFETIRSSLIVYIQ